MTTGYLPEMTGYWDRRYAAEGMVWGGQPSGSAAVAREFFARAGAVRLLVPGAGYGRNARFFAENTYTVTGVETARAAVEMAAGFDPRSTYMHGSMLDVDLEPESFDAVYCFNVLHLFRAAERKLFVEKCFSVLRSGGVAFFAVFSEKEKSFGRGKMVEPDTFESKPGRPVHYFTAEDLAAAFAGYEVIATGILEDGENHGEDGPHTHLLRYICARKAPLDFDAPKYKEYSKHTKGWGAKVVAELRLAGGESVLDLGCGDGLLTRQIADLVPDGRVLGIDSSPGMIGEAAKLAGSNLRFIRQDITELDYRGEFDLIFSNAALHWVRGHENVLERCHTALKDGGLLRFNFAAEGNCPHFIAVTRELMASAEFAPHFTGFSWPWYMPPAAGYQEMVSRLPFRSARVWEDNADTWFPTVDDLAGWIDQPSLVPFLKHLPRGERERFRDAVVARMTGLTRQDDGRYREDFRRLNVLARK